MSLSSYGMFFVGVALGGLVLLAIFSMLVMARKQDEDQDRLEIELRRENNLALHGDHAGSSDNILVTLDSDLNGVSTTKTRMLINR
ncbi:MAG: hypothetical protein WC600_02205 [Desulfobaccales bacterium]